MKITCDTKTIAATVAAAAKIVNAKTTVPILGNLLLVANGNGVTVRSTDMELTFESVFPAEVLESGEVTVPAKLFREYVANLPKGLLELTGSTSRASSKTANSSADFHALPADDYPPCPQRKPNSRSR